MSIKPFLKWAGGKRWIVDRKEFRLPSFNGRYIEPFLGGGAVFFHLKPKKAILSDVNGRLIETYEAIRTDWQNVWSELRRHQYYHCKEYYYQERAKNRRTLHTRAAQFLYLNRACWNGLYRENLQGKFNVPIGTKSKILFESDNFSTVSEYLKDVILSCNDFEQTIDKATINDLVFVDPPYTTAHNFNGFVKYNQTIFSWDDQIRVRNSIARAADRGAKIIVTNAMHQSVVDLYEGISTIVEVPRQTIISGSSKGRKHTAESLIYVGNN